MNAQDRKTLEEIFSQPEPAEICWEAVESMLQALGVTMVARSSTRVALVKDQEVMVLSPPRTKPLAISATIRDLAAFLKTVGIKP